jgi:polyhydroxybutyrate depolymerase
MVLLALVVTGLFFGARMLVPTEHDGGTEAAAPGVEQAASRAPVAPPQPVMAVRTLSVGGTARTYRSFVPPGPPGRYPLVLVLHGRGQSWRTAVDQTGFLSLARRHQAVLVFPDGVGRSWNAGSGCCGLAAREKVADVAFIESVRQDALHRLPVDPSRVYLVGYSNGGKLAYSLDCEHATSFAAVATYGSAPLAACPAGTPPTPFLIANGQRDTILPYGGAAKAHPPTPSVRTAVGWLRAQDGCTGSAQVSRTGQLVRQDWTHCRAGSSVVSLDYVDVGHTWPSTPKAGSPSVSNLMWQFLITHRLPGMDSPVQGVTSRNP